MKRILSLFLVSILSISLISCSKPEAPSTPAPANTTAPTVTGTIAPTETTTPAPAATNMPAPAVSSSPNPVVTSAPTVDISAEYKRKFSHIPSYNGMTLAKFTPPDSNDVAAAIYIINGTTDKKVYENYIGILKKAGWTISGEQKYNTFTATKDKYWALFLLQKAGNNIRLIVNSK